MFTSKRKGKITFYILIAVNFIISVIDNLFTYTGSPDLSKEANPLVHTLGFSWAGLLIANAVLFVLVALMAYYTFVKYQPKHISCSSKKEFLSLVLFNRPDKFKWTWYKLPNNKDGYRFMLACLGFIFAFITPYFRLKASIEWSMYLFNPQLFERYCDIIGKVAVTTAWGRGDAIIEIFLLTIILLLVFVHKQYKANQKLTSAL